MSDIWRNHDNYDSVDSVKRRNIRRRAIQGDEGPGDQARGKEEPEGTFFFAELSGNAEREHEDLLLRSVPRAVAHRFRGAAGARALTHAQYLSALVNLHDVARRRADEGDNAMSAVLEKLGLQTVTI
jgi:hypothetical protein